MLYDKDIREPLFEYIEEKYGKSRIFEEKNIGVRVRADVIVVLPNEIIGMEIKSSVDSYERLKHQVRGYNKYCDRNYIVVGLRHSRHVSEHIPAFWGIILVYEDNRQIIVEELRPALPNPKVNLSSQYSMLWKNELKNILAKHKLPKYADKSKAFIREKLMLKLPADVLKADVCEELFERDYTIYDSDEE